MQLKKVRIDSYKNLKDITVDFSTCNGLMVVAGRNGSGKSNFLEALSLIMCDLYGIEGQSNIPLYEIEFDVGGKTCRSRRTLHDHEVAWLDNGSELIGAGPKTIAMYCGEFKRLLGCGYSRDEGYFALPEMIAVTNRDYIVAFITMLMAGVTAFSDVLGQGGRKITPVSVMFGMNRPFFVGEDGPQDEMEAILHGFSQVPRNEYDGWRHMSFEEFASQIRLDRNPEPRTIYWVLSRLMSPESFDVFLTGVSVILKNERGELFSSEDLSEGEKRLILVKAVFDYLADYDSLVLLDEPDANIHEARKCEVYDIISSGRERGVATVLATHSAMLIDLVPQNQLLLFQREGEDVVARQNENFDAIAEMTGTRMSMFSKRPIILLEGKSDVIILRRVVRYFRENEPGYEKLTVDVDFDFYIIGGCGNAEFVYEEFRRAFPRRRIFVGFDRDKEGRNAFGRLVGRESKCALYDITDRHKPLPKADCAFLLPFPDGFEGQDFMMEDYLPGAFVQNWLGQWLRRCGRFSSVSNPRGGLKECIGSPQADFSPEDFRGFKPLVDFFVWLQKEVGTRV